MSEATSVSGVERSSSVVAEAGKATGRVVHRGHFDRDAGGVAAAIAVVDREGEQVRAVEVGFGRVGTGVRRCSSAIRSTGQKQER